jgi:hypothetical protein
LKIPSLDRQVEYDAIVDETGVEPFFGNEQVPLGLGRQSVMNLPRMGTLLSLKTVLIFCR